MPRRRRTLTKTKSFQNPQDSSSALKCTRLASTTSPGVPCSHVNCCGKTRKAALDCPRFPSLSGCTLRRTALSRGATDPDPDPDPADIRPLKPCLLRRQHNRDQYGVAASCLEELRRKACEVLAIDESLGPVTLVLAEDNSIVDDDDYFLRLPSKTKFVALACNEKGAYDNSDGATAWVSQESFDAHETDSGAGVKWKDLARMLKEDLSNIILLSEDELQVLIDIPCSELAQELCQSCATAQRVQNTLQEVLDQIEDARQFNQMLEQFYRAKEAAILANQEEPKAALGGEVDAVDMGISKEMASEVALKARSSLC
ncbi:DNA fragmentation factor subunit alpha-like [Chionomys nivalis]|uniref:DNA fragmentation factor subunit alpha-like n=1 Tax=Chionomys nivalis TaxID=269649 RepID=UPI00259586D2|nr:DNA fragmentation factor subunit alpha-like [Chionomys nivalis]